MVIVKLADLLSKSSDFIKTSQKIRVGPRKKKDKTPIKKKLESQS